MIPVPSFQLLANGLDTLKRESIRLSNTLHHAQVVTEVRPDVWMRLGISLQRRDGMEDVAMAPSRVGLTGF
jgi:hypothetical protein